MGREERVWEVPPPWLCCYLLQDLGGVPRVAEESLEAEGRGTPSLGKARVET